ncbi:hypothetical protein [Streptomyces sp. SLBN-31]|uniref:hypothetical protein n=1 Tax=Streptomyces sp. SLBN-31 TaxID=2768444 RepID=UPI0011535BB3|nr:hypothetical protein [Streptomyces sp. SLBN-31]TQJ87731.1 hypothetical protein FBY22_6576 [Streptomyces sp. SLBN-31]
MSDLSPSPREGSRSVLPSVDADGLSDALFRLEHPSRARRAWDRSRRMVSDGMQSLMRLLRRVFSRRSAGGGGGGGYEPGAAAAGWQQAPGAPASDGWERGAAQGRGMQRAEGARRPAGREMSPLDQLVRLIGELPRGQRHAFEDAVLNKVRTEGRWRRAYDRDLDRGRDSFLVRFANNAYHREVAPADRSDAARTSVAAVREQLPAYSASAGTAPVPRAASVESPGRDHWDATVAEAQPAAARSRAEAGSTSSALPGRHQEAMPTAEELLAAPDETGVQSSQSETTRSPEPARDTAVRRLDPASPPPVSPPVSPLIPPATPLTPAQLGARYFGSEASLLEGGATVPGPAMGTPPPDNPLGAQATLQRPHTPGSNQRPAQTQTPSRSVPAAGSATRPATRRRG